MSYQKCPICNGDGVIKDTTPIFKLMICPTCGGGRIIHTITGLPPQGSIAPTTAYNVTEYDIKKLDKFLTQNQ